MRKRIQASARESNSLPSCANSRPTAFTAARSESPTSNTSETPLFATSPGVRLCQEPENQSYHDIVSGGEGGTPTRQPAGRRRYVGMNACVRVVCSVVPRYIPEPSHEESKKPVRGSDSYHDAGCFPPPLFPGKTRSGDDQQDPLRRFPQFKNHGNRQRTHGRHRPAPDGIA